MGIPPSRAELGVGRLLIDVEPCGMMGRAGLGLRRKGEVGSCWVLLEPAQPRFGVLAAESQPAHFLGAEVLWMQGSVSGHHESPWGSPSSFPGRAILL